MLKPKLQYFGHLMWRTDSFEKTLMLGKTEAGGEGDNRGCNGWMASLTQWTWVSVNSGSWWWTGRPGMLRSMGLQRVGHDWVTKLNWIFFASTIYGSQRAPCSQQEDLHIALWRPPQGGLFPSHSPSPGPTLQSWFNEIYWFHLKTLPSLGRIQWTVSFSELLST